MNADVPSIVSDRRSRWHSAWPALIIVAIWLVVVLALSVLASLLPARSAARLTIREVLAYE